MSRPTNAKLRSRLLMHVDGEWNLAEEAADQEADYGGFKLEDVSAGKSQLVPRVLTRCAIQEEIALLISGRS